ncbi:acyltransferase family protein [Bradyrhizobium sp. DASA03005]|uniref:acyltransferase family protein n=1 Tax=Bradyrhizobium TaxID=374 RepID=UPI001FEF6F9D|nr:MULTISPECIES: acyltransferase [Bradyrhizobium]
MEKIRELDGLRAIAALLVIAWHYIGAADGPNFWLWNVLYIGHFGVDLFFVLSGFLITTILLENRDAPSFFSSFYGRRAFRIWPIYYLMVAICFFGWLSGTNPVLFNGDVPGWTYLFGIQNFWMAKLQTTGVYWLGGTWSLAIEEQFYLVFPLVVRLVPPDILPRVLIAVILVCPIGRLIDSFTPDTYGYYVLPQFRADVIAIGALIACYRLSRARSVAVTRQVKRVLLGASCFVPVIMISGSATFHAAAWQHTLAAIFFGAVVFMVLENQGASYLAPLRSETGARFARWSYTSYMIHHWVAYLVFSQLGVTRTVTTLSGIAATGLAFVTTFTLCAISYSFLEKPLNQYAHRKFTFGREQKFAVQPAREASTLNL